MNDKPYIDCPGTEPTSPRLDAGEKPLEIWLADFVVFYSLQHAAVMYLYCEIGHYTPPLISLLFHRLPKKFVKY